MKFRVDRREFDRTLRKYAELSSRDIPTIVNTKAYFIARRAVAETPAVSAEEIRAFINQSSGEYLGRIVNKHRASLGKAGLYGKAMTKAIIAMRALRLRSRAFLKSGWLWAVKALAPFAAKRGAPRLDRAAKTFGQAKGSAVPAKAGWRVAASILNTVTAAWDKRDGAAKVAEPALQRAFDFEARSMKDYMAGKLGDSARKAGIKTRS